MTHKRLTGFTLLELMIVVVIVGVLAAIAYPSYKEYVMKSRRSDAKAGLLSLQLAQEKFRSTCTHYASAIGNAYVCDAGAGTYTLKGSTSSPDDNYTMSILSVTTTAYTLLATRKTTELQKNDKCGDFQINQSGEKSVINAASGYDSTKCW